MPRRATTWRRTRSRRRLHQAKPARSRAELGDAKVIARYRLRLEKEEVPPYEAQIVCDRPGTAAKIIFRLFEDSDREFMGGLFLDARHQVIGHTLAYIGTLSRMTVEPRGLLVPALLSNACGLVAFHLHPSGDPEPSSEDYAFTRRLEDGAEFLGIVLHDHLVLGERPKYVSIRHRLAFS